MITHKRGDNFLAECTYTDEDGAPVALTGINITSAIKGPGGILYGLTVTKLDQAESPGRYDVTATGEETLAWSCGAVGWDIQYDRGGFVFSTDTSTITVLEDVTP